MKNNKIVHYFPDTDLRSGHPGLKKMAEKAGVNMESLDTGRFLLFMNRRKTAMKMMVNNKVIAHYKSDTGRIDTRTVKYLPCFFNGGEINYDRALRLVLEKDLEKKGN